MPERACGSSFASVHVLFARVGRYALLKFSKDSAIGSSSKHEASRVTAVHLPNSSLPTPRLDELHDLNCH